MPKYILSYRFDADSDATSEAFAKQVSEYMQQIKDNAITDLQVAVVRLEDAPVDEEQDAGE